MKTKWSSHFFVSMLRQTVDYLVSVPSILVDNKELRDRNDHVFFLD